MIALRKLQQAFAADLWGDDLHYMQGLILDDQLSAAQRFNVYRNNVRTSLTAALAAVYPVLERVVGREFFAFMTDRYIRIHPSRSGNLHNFGDRLPDLLRGFEAASNLPYLADVACLEWAYHVVFHALAPPAFNPNALAKGPTKDYSELRFGIGPASRLVCSDYPILRIWQVNQEDHVGNDTVNLDIGSESVLVVRPALDVELWLLNVAETALLRAFEAGKSLGDAVDASLNCSPDFDLQPVLARYLSSGILIL